MKTLKTIYPYGLNDRPRRHNKNYPPSLEQLNVHPRNNINLPSFNNIESISKVMENFIDNIICQCLLQYQKISNKMKKKIKFDCQENTKLWQLYQMKKKKNGNFIILLLKQQIQNFTNPSKQKGGNHLNAYVPFFLTIKLQRSLVNSNFQ